MTTLMGVIFPASVERRSRADWWLFAEEIEVVGTRSHELELHKD